MTRLGAAGAPSSQGNEFNFYSVLYRTFRSRGMGAQQGPLAEPVFLLCPCGVRQHICGRVGPRPWYCGRSGEEQDLQAVPGVGR